VLAPDLYRICPKIGRSKQERSPHNHWGCSYPPNRHARIAGEPIVGEPIVSEPIEIIPGALLPSFDASDRENGMDSDCSLISVEQRPSDPESTPA
jgi:hypothetical protein